MPPFLLSNVNLIASLTFIGSDEYVITGLPPYSEQ